MDKALENSSNAIRMLERHKYFPACNEDEILLNHALILKHSGLNTESKVFAEKSVNEIIRKVELIKDEKMKDIRLKNKEDLENNIRGYT